MKTESVEKLVWGLIYAGMAFAMLGLWALGDEAGVALVLVIVGALMVAAGAVLVWVRSRMDRTATVTPTAKGQR